MEARDYITAGAVLVSVGSLIVAIIALIKTGRHNAIIRQYASAGPETAVLAQINQGRGKVADIKLKLQEITKGRLPATLSADEKRQIQDIESVYHETVEALLNTYELACGMYRDGKLDRERFRRQYGEEIKKLYDGGTPAYQQRLLPITSPYKAMRAVYEEWYNPEK
jgi:hypothetical protein